MIGVIGAAGAVGAAAVRQLRAWHAPLRAGNRREVDAMDGASLRRFCDGCRVVINCSGPSSPELVRNASGAAFEVGADYVEPAGGDFVFDAVAHARKSHLQRTALVAAGMMPGLTALLPRALAGNASASSLTAYVGGRAPFTRSAALDFLAARGEGRALAAWRGGARVAGALDPLNGIELPHFPGAVNALPYLSSEAERLARALGLTEVRWYTVFDGRHLCDAVKQAGADEKGAERLVRAAALDLFGRTPYQRIVFDLDGRTLVLHGRDASELTGTFAALAARSLTSLRIPPGVYYAGEVLDPSTAIEDLRGAEAVVSVDVPGIEATRGSTFFEEGAL